MAAKVTMPPTSSQSVMDAGCASLPERAPEVERALCLPHGLQGGERGVEDEAGGADTRPPATPRSADLRAAERRPAAALLDGEQRLAHAEGHEAREHHQARDAHDQRRQEEGRPADGVDRTSRRSGPASRRGRANRLEKSAYWVAEKRFCVMRSSSTEKAPVPEARR